MLWSGSSPLSVVRDGMWGFLLFAGVAWLSIAWSVLRLEPADFVNVAGPVILFGAVTEVVRALAGTRTWWLNAGMAVLFAATGALLLADAGTTWTTPAALIGWYLMVRGAADIAISMLTREADRIWGMLLVVGVAETALGFFSASVYARTPELVIVVLAGAALTRAVADLVASLRLREASVAARAERLLELTPERAVGVAGYSAGLTDFEAGMPARAAGPRHRAMARAQAGPVSDLSAQHSSDSATGSGPQAVGPGTSTHTGGLGPNTAEGLGSGTRAAVLGDVEAALEGLEQATGHGNFHDEVLRTTADLDAMLALAGVTGAAVPGAAARAAANEQVEVPDTAEGAELPVPEEAAAAASMARGRRPVMSDSSLPLLDPAARAAEAATPGMDDTAIIARRRTMD